MFEIARVDKGSVGEKYGIQKGEKIARIDGQQLIDYIDYVYFCAKHTLKIKLLGENGYRTLRIKKREDEDLGLEFTQPLLGEKRVCRNKCVFCFVDQLPKGMRRSLYVKDEDWRYSFVMGNYVTLSSISKSELRRIIKRQVSPLYISVHTVNEHLRRRMLGNDTAISVRRLLKKLAANGIKFHAQTVVCPGLNDKEDLEKTFRYLKKLHPSVMSLAVVPVGLTAHREGLFPITPITKEMASVMVKEVEKWQKECLNRLGTRFVFAADEYYIKAGVALPSLESYESFDQIENGVGMMAKLLHEADEAMAQCGQAKRHLVIATGEDAYPFFETLAKKARDICGVSIDVHKVYNHTFGGGVTVSGLLGGGDFITALAGKNLGDGVLITADALRDGQVFLDDVTLEQLQKALGTKVYPVDDGYHFGALIAKG